MYRCDTLQERCRFVAYQLLNPKLDDIIEHGASVCYMVTCGYDIIRHALLQCYVITCIMY